jgi:dTDP-4-dehydrorhamnose 3,5-epimerase
MRFQPLAIADVVLIEPHLFHDPRGFFFEAYEAGKYAEAGITATLVQDNHSGSHAGVLRGLHYQLKNPQGKLVSVVAGEIFDVAVDLRRSSATRGNWVGTCLSADNRRQLWIPPGFAHGYYVLSPWAEVTYKVSDFYNPQAERTLLWNDPDLRIDWPLIEGRAPILSAKDALGTPLAQAELYDEL